MNYDTRVISAVIAGNNNGKEIDGWQRELVAVAQGIETRTLAVAARKQAADIALVLELGGNLERHIRERERVVIVSRDDLLVGAAEQAKERGSGPTNSGRVAASLEREGVAVGRVAG